MKLFKYCIILISVVICGVACKKGNSTVVVGESYSNGEGLDVKKYEGVKSEGDFDFFPTSTTNQIIKHSFYSLSYNEQSEQAEWVAYHLKREYLKNSNFKRPYFIADDLVSSGSADWRNYKNSNFDKGHLCPAGDMEFNLNAYNDTFFTSNIAPQDHDFNGGIWNRLEQKVRYWADKFNGVYVVTGGVLKPSLKTIGSEEVAVPKFFYKIILNRSSNGSYKIVAFLMPNKASQKPLFDYVVSVDYVESITGIDFFPALEDGLENKLEKSVNTRPWFSN